MPLIDGISPLAPILASINSLQNAATATSNVIGGIPVLYRIDFANAATSNVDLVLQSQTRILDCRVVKTGGAGGAADTVQLQTAAGAANITDAIDTNDADQTVSRAGTIDDANHTIASGGTLRVRRVNGGAGNAACIVYVYGLVI